MKETLNLQNDVSEVKQLAEWIEDIGSRLKLHASVIFKLNLALEEAVVNVIDYAYPGRTGMPISLTAKDCGNKLVFTLTGVSDDIKQVFTITGFCSLFKFA